MFRIGRGSKSFFVSSRNRLKTVSEEGIEIVEFTDDMEVVVTSIREETGIINETTSDNRFY